MFLYIDPLKQGLKHGTFSIDEKKVVWFLYIDPLKQGLKLKKCVNISITPYGFYT